MKSVGIVTIHKINNYGAALQAYSLNKFLRDNKYDAQTIDFCTYRVAESKEVFFKNNNIKNIIRNLLILKDASKLRKRNQNFDEFINSNIVLSNKTYYSNDEIKSDDLSLDYYICGSDQIWNTHCLNYSPAFLLDFVDDKSKCLSYAASMGADTIADSAIEDFERNLKSYKAISVRENSIVDIISKVSDKEVTHVCDPVFLLDGEKWSQIAKEDLIGKPYIFFYFVHNGDIEGMRDFVAEKSKEYNLPVVVVNRDPRELKYKNIKAYDAGPSEFLSYVKNAKVVCTNSFHAFSFSIIFRKNFWVFASKDIHSGASRIYSQAEKFGLGNRVLNRDNSKDIDFLENADFSNVDKNLQPFIDSSKEFLLSNLD